MLHSILIIHNDLVILTAADTMDPIPSPAGEEATPSAKKSDNINFKVNEVKHILTLLQISVSDQL